MLRLAGVDVVPGNVVLLGPLQDRSAGELRPVARQELLAASGYGRLRSLQIAQRAVITGAQVSMVELPTTHHRGDQL